MVNLYTCDCGNIIRDILSSNREFCNRCQSYVKLEVIHKKSKPEKTENLKKPEKTPFELLDLEFAAVMCNNFKEGIKGDRKANGWKKLKMDEDMKDAYIAKILRHLHEYLKTGDCKNLAAIACNANIIYYHESKPIDS